MKRYYLSKLFGGPRNGQRFAAPESDSSIYIATSRPALTYYPDGGIFPEAVPFRQHIYTRHHMRLGPNIELTYFADSRLSEEEAADRVTRAMLRAVKAVEV